MEKVQKTYRIRTDVGENAPTVLNIPLNQTYDMFEILSLKINQANSYKTFDSTVGVVVGRVIANGGVGVENAKLSIFIPVDDNEEWAKKFIYEYYSTNGLNEDGVRYNLLLNSTDDACHAIVGTFPNKRLVLDNENYIEIFDKYWKYTTTTNKAGDYMMSGIPVGSQMLHVDVDLSDCGILSQRPRDLIGQGYNEKMFESPNKFKKSTNLNSLVQIYSQDRGLYIYPYWGDTSESSDKFSITRCDIELTYEFKPTCVFMGSIMTDKGSNSIGKNCTAKISAGDMSALTTGEGTIEMIRKTLDGKVESFSIEGDRLIDSDGVWCYQIPMNLDYVTTNEEGSLVPTDNPEKGIATRAKVRFRIGLSENVNDNSPYKKCKYLVPNNPRLLKDVYPEFYSMENKEADYEFGTKTKEESFANLFWNNVYTVKNYIPRLQKNRQATNKKHTGIKQIKYFGDNNPMPYNAMDIKLSFTHRIICVLTKLFIQLIAFLNFSLALLSYLPCKLCEAFKKICRMRIGPVRFGRVFTPIKEIFCNIVLTCISLSSEFCDDSSGIRKTYYPGCHIGGALGRTLGLDCVWKRTRSEHNKRQKDLPPEEQTEPDYRPDFNPFSNDDKSTLLNCVENSLAQDNDATSFKFQNDWVNGVLYAPLWFRRIRPKKRYLFGLFKRKAKDQWCKEDGNYGLYFYQNGIKEVTRYSGGFGDTHNSDYTSYFTNDEIIPYVEVKDCGNKCYNSNTTFDLDGGLILTRETMLGHTVYYYKAINYVDGVMDVLAEDGEKGAVELLYATDIVLLGSLNDCDLHGVPQFFKSLDSTTYNMPSDLEFVDVSFNFNIDPDSEDEVTLDVTAITEETGCDWGNLNSEDQCGKMGKDDDGGLFYDIGCSGWYSRAKTAVNLRRICEFGVVIDSSKFVHNLPKLEGGEEADDDDNTGTLRPDGYVSYDELQLLDERSMFATMNGNRLRTVESKQNGLLEYDFRYLYCDNFDGALKQIMENRLKKCQNVTYKFNGKLEEFSFDYYMFRMGEKPYFYDKNHTFARYENSFYFYFGLKAGKTAIDKFNTKFFSECADNDEANNPLNIDGKGNDWCSEISNKLDGYVKFDFTGLTQPFDVIINSDVDGSISWKSDDPIIFDKFYFGDAEDDSGLFDGYQWVADMMLPNGEYVITVTDNDGTIVSTKFTLKTKYLSYRTTTTDFLVDNSFLKTFYGPNYNDIAKGGNLLESDDENFPFNSKREDVDPSNNETLGIGGVITVYGIFNGGEQMNYDANEYKITVRPVDSDLYKVEGYNWVCIYNATNLPDCVKRTTITDMNGNATDTFLIGVPKGDITYKVTVTQLCNGVDSLNSVTKYLKVAQPIPVKLFVNDVDIDLLKNFNAGWEVSGKVDNSLKFTPNMSALCGWDEIGNIWGNESAFLETCPDTLYYYDTNNEVQLNLDLQDLLRIIDILHTEEIAGSYYHWTDDYLTDFTRTSFTALGGAEYVGLSPLQEGALIEIDRVYQKRRNLPNEMRAAFFITCSDSRNGVNAQLQTNSYPVNYAINYPEDFMTEDEDIKSLKKNSSDRSNCTREFTEDANIEGVYIPTLTYPESPDFGGADAQHSDTARNLAFTFAKNFEDVEDLSKKIYKTPYVVGACDALGITKPDGLDLENVDPKKLDAEGGDATKYFMFHLIDKIISMEKIAWSYFYKIPFYEPSTSTYSGEFITMNGILAARINNGVAEDLGNSLTQYNRQTYASYNLLIKRFCTDTEDSLPTRRVVMGIDVTDLVEGTLDTLGLNPATDADVDDLIQHIMDFANLSIISSIGLDVLINAISNELNDILNGTLGEESVVVNLEFSDEVNVEDDEIINNIVTFDLGSNVSTISVTALTQNADWVSVDTSYNSASFTCSRNHGASRSSQYSMTFDNGKSHRIDFTIVQDTNGLSVVYVDYNNVSHTFANTEEVVFNVKMTKVESLKQLLENGVEDVIRSYFYPFRKYYVTDRSNFEGCEDEKTDIDMQYSPIFRLDEDIDIADESGCSPEDDETAINGRMNVTLLDDSINECTTNEGGTILHVSADDVDEDGRYYLYRLREDFTYPLNYVQKDGNYTFVDEIIKDEWQNTQNDAYNIFSFATKSAVLEDIAKSSSNIHKVNGRDYFKSSIVTEEEEGTNEVTTHGYGNTGLFEMTGGVALYPNFRGKLFIVAETKGHCRAISPVYDFSVVEGALKMGYFYDVESVQVAGVGTTYQQRLNGSNQPLDVLGISVANFNDLYYFKWYEYEISFTTNVLGTSAISESGTLKQGVCDALLVELNGEMKTALAAKFATNKMDVISMSEMIATDASTLRHRCLLKESNIGGSSNWFAIAWDLNNEFAIWEDGTRAFKKTIHEQGSNVEECPFNVIAPADNKFLGWSTVRNDPPLPTPYVTNINSSNWPIALYAVWQNGSDVTYHTVNFYENDEATLIASTMVIENFYATAPSGHEESGWYEVGDATKTPIDLSTTPITRDMSLAEMPIVIHTVRWLAGYEEQEPEAHTVTWTREMFEVHFVDEHNQEIED